MCVGRHQKLGLTTLPFVYPKLENDDGETLFVPPDVDPENEDDCYFSIKEVLSRLEQRRDEEEAEIADTYREEMSRPVDRSTPQKRKQRSEGGDEQTHKKPKLDLSWKESLNFPRRTSRVGKEYQVTNIPKAGTVNDEKDENR